MLGRIILIGAAFSAVGAANWLSWRSLRAEPLPLTAVAHSTAALAWAAFTAISSDASGVRFPAALNARDGSAVELVGVLFALPQLVENGNLTGAVLAPPAKFSCCGLSCETRSVSLVFVTPRGPLADPGRQRLARVTGTLRLHHEPGHWSPSEVADAQVELLPDP